MNKLPIFEEELVNIIKSLGVKDTQLSSEPTEELETTTPEEEAVKEHKVAPVSTVTAKNLFHHPDAHPIILSLALLRRFGADWYFWDPDVLEVVIPKEFNVSSVSHVNLAKINACKTLALVDGFWERWEMFGWCTMALNGIPPDFDLVQVPTPSQMAVAIDSAHRLRLDVPWSSEVEEYIKQVLLFNGLVFAAPPFDFLDFAPDEYLVDIPAIEKRWPEVRRAKKAPEGDTVEDEQLRRLLEIELAVEKNQELLRDQLEILSHV